MVDELIFMHLPLTFTAGEWVRVSIRESGHGRIGWYDHGLVVASFVLIAIVNTLYRDKWLSIDTIMIPILVLLWNFSHWVLTATRPGGRSYRPGVGRREPGRRRVMTRFITNEMSMVHADCRTDVLIIIRSVLNYNFYAVLVLDAKTRKVLILLILPLPTPKMIWIKLISF